MTLFGHDLYIDGDAVDTESANAVIIELLDERFNKPDWYYRAKARDALGLS